MTNFAVLTDQLAERSFSRTHHIIESVAPTPPSSPVSGARYLVASSGTSGVFVGRENNIAVYVADTWTYLVAASGWTVFNRADETDLRFNGTAWIGLISGSGTASVAAGVLTLSDAHTVVSAESGTTDTITSVVLPSTMPEGAVVTFAAASGHVLTITNGASLQTVYGTDTTVEGMRVMQVRKTAAGVFVWLMGVGILERAESVSAWDFGAVGDGTDETSALQAWLNAAKADRKVALLPAGYDGGHYLATSTLTLTDADGLQIVGAGYNTTLKGQVSGADLLTIRSSDGVIVRNLRFDASEVTAGNTWQGCALGLVGCNDATVDRLWGRNGQRAFVMLESCNDSYVSRVTVDDCAVAADAIDGSASGIFVTINSQRNVIDRCHLTGQVVGVRIQPITDPDGIPNNNGSDASHNTVSRVTAIDSFAYAFLAYEHPDTFARAVLFDHCRALGVRGSIRNPGNSNSQDFGAAYYSQNVELSAYLHCYAADTHQTTTDLANEVLSPGAFATAGSGRTRMIGCISERAGWHAFMLADTNGNAESGMSILESCSAISAHRFAYYIKDLSNVRLNECNAEDGSNAALMINRTVDTNPRLSNIKINGGTLRGKSGVNAVLANIIDSEVEVIGTEIVDGYIGVGVTNSKAIFDGVEILGHSLRGLAAVDDVSEIVLRGRTRIAGNGIGINQAQRVTVDADTVFENNTTDIVTDPADSNAFQTITHRNSLVAFSAYANSVQADVTGDGTAYTVAFTGEDFDPLGMFNNGTGVLTAPISGYYELTAQVEVSGFDTSHSQMDVVIVTTNSASRSQINRKIVGANDEFPQVESLSVRLLVYLAKDDTASVSLTVSGSAKTIDVSPAANGRSHFYGQLIRAA